VKVLPPGAKQAPKIEEETCELFIRRRHDRNAEASVVSPQSENSIASAPNSALTVTTKTNVDNRECAAVRAEIRIPLAGNFWTRRLGQPETRRA
jgi:hypothetical protein